MGYDYENSLNEYMHKDGKLNNIEQGRYFTEWVLTTLFNRTSDEIETNDIDGNVLMIDGCNDKGIDCCFRDADTLYILQCKFRSQHTYNEVNNFYMQMSNFFSRENGNELNNKVLTVWNLIHDKEVNQIKVYYITNNDLSSEATNYGYDKLSNQFETTFASLGKSITFEIIGIEKYQTIQTGILLELPKEIRMAQAELILENSFENRDKNSIVAEVALKNLAGLINKYHKYIFFSNIRNYKGLNKVNKVMQDTYKNHPKDFWFYNNGITIVCKDYSFVRDNLKGRKTYKITAPQIVNGCQTASTIFNNWNASSEYEKNNLDATILVKIIKDPKEEKRREITKYTNSQTAVTGKDFFALENFHKELQNSFEKLGYYYEIQSNARKNTNKKYKGSNIYNILFDSKFKNYNSFTAKDVVQLYVACILQSPAKAKNIGAFMPGGDKYEKAFNNETPKDPRYYIIPYGIYYYLKNSYQFPEKKIDKDKWKASLLFTSSIFFKIIYKNCFNEEIDYKSSPFINKCDEIIENKELFNHFIDLTKDVIVDFYKDSKIKDIIGDNLPKFLKSTIETNKDVINILNQKIEDNIE